MGDSLPYSEKKLKDWAGWRAFRDGKALFDRGVVEKVTYEHPFVTGQLNLGPRGMRSKFEILKNGLVENHCPCRDNQEKGLICSHLVAMGLEVLKREKASSLSQLSASERQRIDRIAKAAEGTHIQRVRQDVPGAVKARLWIELAVNWQSQLAEGRITIHVSIEYEKTRKPVADVPTTVPFSFTHQDENLFYLLEGLCGGVVKNEIQISVYDLINILRKHHGKVIHQKGQRKGLSVNRNTLDSELLMDMDRESGELLLDIYTKLPDDTTDLFPSYIIGEKSGWIFASGQFWPLNSILPKSLQEVYRTQLIIPRETVPAFLMSELPQVEKVMSVRTDITPELFYMKPAKPEFRLVVKGSAASLAARLYARYNDQVELVAGRADMKGNFAIPDPRDLLRYRIRNMAAEKEAVKKLEHVGFIGRAGDTLKNMVGERDVLNFLGTGVPQVRRMGWQVELEGRVAPFENEALRVSTTVHVDESESGDYFEVSYEYDIGTGSVSERDIQRALENGDSFIKRNGRTILLDGDAIIQAREVFRDCAEGAGSKLGSFRMKGIYDSYVEASIEMLDGVELRADNKWMERARQQNDQESLENVELHPKLQGTLRSYQQEGVNWLRFLEKRGFCGVLADEMGLGKTLQTLAWVQLARSDEQHRGKPTLIICPTSLVENWCEEAAKFTPNLKVLTLHGADRHRKWKNIEKSDLVITSYALMRRDIERHLEYTYSIAILDEAQHIKNRSTQNALAAKKIKADHRLVLTGTPIENGVTDLWSIMDYLMPGYLGHHKDFREHYELPILNGGEEGKHAQSKLRRKLHPFLLRRLKKQVARDLPPKIERLAPCKLTQDQHKVYKQLLEDSKARINEMVEQEGFNKSRMEILKTLLRLRQTCNHIDLLKLNGVKSKHPSAKMELFFELLNEALDSKHRVLVFSQFTSMLAILRKELEDRDMKYCYLDGSTKDRQDVVRRFNKDHSIPVFLMSLKAGGTGLNLTGADMVIHFDPWWNPAVEDQATDRAHRIGQKRTVYSVKLITKGTVEEKVLAMQKRKKDIIDSTLTTDEQIMQKLTWEDVQELLNL
ncbi:MAG TPA: SNF2-related protein [Pontiella sp.]